MVERAIIAPDTARLSGSLSSVTAYTILVDDSSVRYSGFSICGKRIASGLYRSNVNGYQVFSETHDVAAPS